MLNFIDVYKRAFQHIADAINLLFFCQSAL